MPSKIVVSFGANIQLAPKLVISPKGLRCNSAEKAR